MAVVLLLLVIVAPFVQALTAQAAPRVATTGALVDDGSLVIDDYLLGVDFTTRDGRRYSDKAPAQAVLAIPGYIFARAVGAEPAVVPRVDENLTLWWVSLTTSLLPLVGGVWLMGAAIRRRGREPQLPVLVAMAFGTMLLPLASNLYGHVLAGVLAYAAWSILDAAGGSPSAARAACAGLVAAVAVTAEYQVVLVAIVLGTWLAVRQRWRPLAAFVAAGLPGALALALYQRAATGSALRSGYQDKEWEGETGFFSTHITHPPSPAQLLEILVGSRGLLVFTPIVLLALLGLVGRWRRTRDDGAVVAMVILAAFLLLQASWANTWAGAGPGPRYVAPALPFLAIGLAEVWGTVSPPIRRAALAVSVTAMGLATVTNHLVPEGDLLVVTHLRKLVDEGAVPTVFTMALGPAGWVLHGALAAAAIAFAVREMRAAPSDGREAAVG